jgi:hypothetical protein
LVSGGVVSRGVETTTTASGSSSGSSSITLKQEA